MRMGKKSLAYLLALAMSASLVQIPVYAQEGPTWMKEGENWRYKKSDGTFVMGPKIREIKDGKGLLPYFFDENGYMASDRTVEFWPEDETLPKALGFAFPYGNLASKAWVHLAPNGEGGLSIEKDESNPEAHWYYFDENMDMVKNRFFTDPAGKTYLFDENGVMYSDTFVYVENWDTGEGNEICGDGIVLDESHYRNGYFYFQHDGELASGKWLKIDGTWYHFASGNEALGIRKGTLDILLPDDLELLASSSDASEIPKLSRSVEALTPKTDREITMKVGETVRIAYTAQLASPSDAEAEYETSDALTKHHDFWNRISGDSNDYKAKFVTPSEKEPNRLYVELTAKAPFESTVLVYVDGVASEPVMVTAVAGELADEKKESMEIVLGNSEADSVSRQEALTEIYRVSGEDARAVLEESWKTQKEQIQELEAAYNWVQVIETEENVSEQAAVLLGSKAVNVTGAGLNGEKGDNLALMVEEGTGTALSSEYADVERVDFDIRLEVNAKAKPELELPVIITMPVPEKMAGGEFTLLHTHDGVTETVPYTTDGLSLEFVTDKFSNYTFVAGKKGDEGNGGNESGGNESGGNGGSTSGEDRDDSDWDSGSGSGSHSRSVDRKETGSWKQDARGWWYQNRDGSYPVSVWKQLDFGGRVDWYHFGPEGYMDFGWFTDSDGNRYYLNPVSDGTMGAMQTGWKQIDGKWYYFNPVSDGKMGALVTNSVVDGYLVDENGVWKEN